MAPKAPACLGARLEAICVVLLELAINIYRSRWEHNILHTTVNTLISVNFMIQHQMFAIELTISQMLTIVCDIITQFINWFDDDWEFVNKLCCLSCFN